MYLIRLMFGYGISQSVVNKARLLLSVVPNHYSTKIFFFFVDFTFNVFSAGFAYSMV